MKSNILIVVVTLCVLLLASACGKKEQADSLVDTAINEVSEGNVYVCTGPTAHAYHTNPNCKGLDNCSREIITTSEENAIEMGRHLCHFCEENDWNASR